MFQLALFVYDISNYTSFENLESWLMAVSDATRHQTRTLRQILVANKGRTRHKPTEALVSRFAALPSARLWWGNKMEGKGGKAGIAGTVVRLF